MFQLTFTLIWINKRSFKSTSCFIFLNEKIESFINVKKQAQHSRIVFSEYLEQEWNDRLSARIIFKLLLVVPVLPEGPDRHLVEASQGEEGSWEALSHHGEADPGPYLVSVVGA